MKPHAGRAILIVAIGLCLVASHAVAAPEPAVVRAPEQPAPVHRFFDRQNVIIFSVNAMVMTADLYTTRQALQVPGAREGNPLMSNQAAAIPLKIGTVGAGIGMAYMLHRTGHHKAERIVPRLIGVPSTIAAVHNAGIHR